MTGGRTRDGGDIVGASVFYNQPPPDDETCGNKTSGAKKSDDPVKTLDVVALKFLFNFAPFGLILTA